MLTLAQLEQLILADPDLFLILQIIDQLGLKDSWLCAGSLRNFIWHHLSDRPGFDPETDVDVIFYDPVVTTAQTQAIEAGLVASFPQYAWQLRNQVTMHHHSPETAPYQSARDAMARFPETCTAIGARLKANHELELFVPYGLEDVCHFLVRPTPHY